MKKRVIFMLLAALMLLGNFIVTGFAAGSETPYEDDIEQLIAKLPEVSDPMGTEYYFYNQLTDVEKVIYWKINEATWEKPEITISGLAGYSEGELRAITGRAVTALIADKPMKHLLWDRWGVEITGYDGNTLIFRPKKENDNSEYLIRKAEARIRQIVETVGTEGDVYSRTRDLLELMYQEMDYDPYHPFGCNRKASYNDSAIGCLVYGNAVCAGFSDTVKILCDELKIPCITVGNAGHAWNYVRMDDGQWYAVDASRDVPFDWNCNIVGSESEQYANEPNYSISDLYHGREGDFYFPVLCRTEYIYDGEYSASYHDADFTFVEPSPTFAYEVNGDGKSCTIVAYEGEQRGDLVIPGSIDGYIVTAIGDGAFYRNSGFTGNVIIPDSVKEIGPCAFQACTGLSGELVLSQGLESIGEHAFLGNKSMTGSLNFPTTLASVGRCAFYDCESITGDVALPEGITLGDEIFSNCKSLTGTLYLPDDMVWGDNITNASGITSIHVNETSEKYATHDGVLFSKDMKTLLACPGGKTGDLVIPEGVETIARIACYRCTNLSGTLTLPESLKTIGEFAFNQTQFTGDLIIPDSVEEIGSNAFSGNAFDGALKLPTALTRIEDSTFFACAFTGDLIIPDNVSYVGQWAFLSAGFDGQIYVPETIAYIGDNAIFGDFTNSLELKDTDTVIAEYAFAGAYFDYFSCNCGLEYSVNENPTEIIYLCPRCQGKYIIEVERPSGDIDGNKTVDVDDVLALLWNVLFPDEYPIEAEADFDGNGETDVDDVLTLLWHVLFPDDYPLN